MGFRFRKSITLLPGVRLNVSKGGLSASVGPHGATVNLGRKGVTATVGLPGTGLSYSKQILSTRPGPPKPLPVPAAQSAFVEFTTPAGTPVRLEQTGGLVTATIDHAPGATQVVVTSVEVSKTGGWLHAGAVNIELSHDAAVHAQALLDLARASHRGGWLKWLPWLIILVLGVVIIALCVR